jgi:hypothetical protein
MKTTTAVQLHSRFFCWKLIKYVVELINYDRELRRR